MRQCDNAATGDRAAPDAGSLGFVVFHLDIGHSLFDILRFGQLETHPLSILFGTAYALALSVADALASCGNGACFSGVQDWAEVVAKKEDFR